MSPESPRADTRPSAHQPAPHRRDVAGKKPAAGGALPRVGFGLSGTDLRVLLNRSRRTARG